MKKETSVTVTILGKKVEIPSDLASKMKHDRDGSIIFTDSVKPKPTPKSNKDGLLSIDVKYKLVAPALEQFCNTGQMVPSPMMVELSVDDLKKKWDEQKMPYNRPVKESLVKSMMKSIVEYGVLRYPIFFIEKGNKTLLLADGQHLIEAVHRLGLPLIRANVLNLEDRSNLPKMVAIFNSTGVKWSNLDYINFYSHASEDYKVLLGYANESGYSTTVISMVLSGGCKTTRQTIKTGKFQIADINKAKFQIAMMDMFHETTKTKKDIYADSALFEFVELYYDLGLNKFNSFAEQVRKQLDEKMPIGVGHGSRLDFVGFYRHAWNVLMTHEEEIAL